MTLKSFRKITISLFFSTILIPCQYLIPLSAEEDPDYKPIVSPTKFKELPKKRPQGADVIVESTEVMDDCSAEAICIEGLVYNQGNKPAFQSKLRIDLGGSGKYIRPRTFYYEPLALTTMNPGDRQEFSIRISRKKTYMKNGEEKVIEVGKYNYQIVPVWQPTPPKSKTSKKWKLTKPK